MIKKLVKNFDFFTFNNIAGRSGRMFEHFIGRVFLFHEPPQEELPFVDFPFFTQPYETPESLLVQIEQEDLTRRSSERILDIENQKYLSLYTIKKNSCVDPSDQIRLAEYLFSTNKIDYLTWINYPSYKQLEFTCAVLWHFLIKKRKNEVVTGKQLAFKIFRLSQRRNFMQKILDEMQAKINAAINIDEAIERVLLFERNWAGFDFPKYLLAFDNIQKEVFLNRGIEPGNYSNYAKAAECLFEHPLLSTLDEFGVPSQVTKKILQVVDLSDDIDNAIRQLKAIDIKNIGLDDFEIKFLQSFFR